MTSSIREIPLTRGLVALVDAADFDRLNQWKWCATPDGYAKRAGKMVRGVRAPAIYMHREVYGAARPIDHIDGNRANNTRANLRLCNDRQNQYNRGPDRGREFKGVYPAYHRWRARITADGKSICLGCFGTPAEAARAYDAAARQLHGEFARLNFPVAT